MISRRELLKIAGKTAAVLPFLAYDLWQPRRAEAAISFFGLASNPADNGTLDHTVARPITSPASMLANDYVVVLALAAAAAATTISVSNNGGQTWTSETQVDFNTNFSSRIFHCRFDGTWTANPSFVTVDTAANNFNLVMLVFRGVDTVTALDVALASATYAAPGGAPYDVTRSGITTNTAGAMVVAFWIAQDNCAWTLQTAGWSQGTPVQNRNSTGADTSISHAFKIVNATGSGDIVNTQETAVGPDAGLTYIFALKAAVAGGGSAALIRRRGM